MNIVCTSMINGEPERKRKGRKMGEEKWGKKEKKEKKGKKEGKGKKKGKKKN